MLSHKVSSNFLFVMREIYSYAWSKGGLQHCPNSSLSWGGKCFPPFWHPKRLMDVWMMMGTNIKHKIHKKCFKPKFSVLFYCTQVIIEVVFWDQRCSSCVDTAHDCFFNHALHTLSSTPTLFEVNSNNYFLKRWISLSFWHPIAFVYGMC